MTRQAPTPFTDRAMPIAFLMALMLLGSAAVLTSGTLWQDAPGPMLIGQDG